MVIRSSLFFVLLLALAVAWQNDSAASSDWKKNTSLMPQYCKDLAKGNNSPEWTKWRSTFGESTIHMNHYCKGVFAEDRAKSIMDKNKRDYWLGILVHQMRYVSSSCKKKCVLYPDLHTRLGWALGEQGLTAEAIEHYQLAFKAKPDYALAYARLSELYLGIGQPEDARKILESGLKASPNSRALKRRLEKLESSD
jgi:tetratricopeptide (TPR) repeat protein